MKQPVSYETLQAIIDPIVIDKESCDMEYKTALGGFPQSFWETYSAFANTNGGTIVFGIKEQLGQFLLDGLDLAKAEKYEADFFNMMHNREKVNMPLLQENDVHIVQHNNSYFLVFYVPRARREQRPIYCGRDPYTGTYRRDLDGDYHCTLEEVRSMFADANTGMSADGRILKNFTMADLDQTSIQQYRRLFQNANPDHVWNRLSDYEFLQKLNVFRTDRETETSGLTLAGLLMFGTYSALMDGCPNFFPDYQEITDSAERWQNRICPNGNWESNLFQFYWKVLPILQEFLPKPFVLEGNQRVSDTPARVAIREAFTNALIHADYSQNASLNVYKYPTSIVFSNPGTMLISLPQYYKGGESVCRNRYLQTLFAFLGSAEKAGSGSDKIVHGWESLNWARPIIEEKAHPNKVVLSMKMESLIDDRVKEKLVNIFGETVFQLPRYQLLILALAVTEEAVSNEYLQSALGIHKADIRDILREMCDKNLLLSDGHGRGTIYVLPSATFEDGSATFEGGSATFEGGSATFEDGSATLQKHKKLNSQKRQEMILDYCSVWRSVEDIAAYTGLTKVYIRNKLLPKMEKLLERRYNLPRHPKQKYRRKGIETIG
ncbi:MAG: RNA-binding domain-containing protein [Paludibacteraceae bacterium]